MPKKGGDEKIARIEKELIDVKVLLKSAIEKAIERKENIENLVSKTEELKYHADRYVIKIKKPSFFQKLCRCVKCGCCCGEQEELPLVRSSSIN